MKGHPDKAGKLAAEALGNGSVALFTPDRRVPRLSPTSEGLPQLEPAQATVTEPEPAQP